jgi:hypothetical protein
MHGKNVTNLKHVFTTKNPQPMGLVKTFLNFIGYIDLQLMSDLIVKVESLSP